MALTLTIKDFIDSMTIWYRKIYAVNKFVVVGGACDKYNCLLFLAVDYNSDQATHYKPLAYPP